MNKPSMDKWLEEAKAEREAYYLDLAQNPEKYETTQTAAPETTPATEGTTPLTAETTLPAAA